MFVFKLLLPLMAQLDPVQLVEEAAVPEEEVVVLDDPSEIYEIEFDIDEDLAAFESDEFDSECNP